MKAEIFNTKFWVEETNVEKLKPLLNTTIKNSGYTIVGFSEHYFKPQGYTCVWLLAESHLALHTFPEENKSYIELSGCNEQMTRNFVINIKKVCFKIVKPEQISTFKNSGK